VRLALHIRPVFSSPQALDARDPTQTTTDPTLRAPLILFPPYERLVVAVCIFFFLPLRFHPRSRPRLRRPRSTGCLLPFFRRPTSPFTARIPPPVLRVLDPLYITLDFPFFGGGGPSLFYPSPLTIFPEGRSPSCSTVPCFFQGAMMVSTPPPLFSQAFFFSRLPCRTPPSRPVYLFLDFTEFFLFSLSQPLTCTTCPELSFSWVPLASLPTRPKCSMPGKFTYVRKYKLTSPFPRPLIGAPRIPTFFRLDGSHLFTVCR